MKTKYMNLIENYTPNTAMEESVKRSIKEYVDFHGKTVLTRENLMAHMTASTVILNEDATRMLMIYHKIYNAWTWQGGHADGEEDLLMVALKEAKEETGLRRLVAEVDSCGNFLYTLDILPVKGHRKNGDFVAPHMHLNAAFVLTADENDLLVMNEEETEGIMWVPVEKIDQMANEPDITPIYHRLIQKVKMIRRETR